MSSPTEAAQALLSKDYSNQPEVVLGEGTRTPHGEYVFQYGDRRWVVDGDWTYQWTGNEPLLMVGVDGEAFWLEYDPLNFPKERFRA